MSPDSPPPPHSCCPSTIAPPPFPAGRNSPLLFLARRSSPLPVAPLPAPTAHAPLPLGLPHTSTSSSFCFLFCFLRGAINNSGGQGNISSNLILGSSQYMPLSMSSSFSSLQLLSLARFNVFSSLSIKSATRSPIPPSSICSNSLPSCTCSWVSKQLLIGAGVAVGGADVTSFPPALPQPLVRPRPRPPNGGFFCLPRAPPPRPLLPLSHKDPGSVVPVVAPSCEEGAAAAAWSRLVTPRSPPTASLGLPTLGCTTAIAPAASAPDCDLESLVYSPPTVFLSTEFTSPLSSIYFLFIFNHPLAPPSPPAKVSLSYSPLAGLSALP
ncbi:hypothetical protein M758_UG001600 [Ceratodon purpureus]|nr:hypothetical protein M758_UG001600 [Ceratodon purpureus]